MGERLSRLDVFRGSSSTTNCAISLRAALPQPRAAPLLVMCNHNDIFHGVIQGQDLNLRLSGYEPDELPDARTGTAPASISSKGTLYGCAATPVTFPSTRCYLDVTWCRCCGQDPVKEVGRTLITQPTTFATQRNTFRWLAKDLRILAKPVYSPGSYRVSGW